MNNLIADQLKKPRGIFGHFIFNKLEKFNIPIYENTIEILDIQKNDRILEIGYGTGKLMNMILERHADIEIAGIDFSKLMYNRARKLNHKYLTAGRVALYHGDFMDCHDHFGEFDIIFGLNVMYFFDVLMIDKMYGILKKKGKAVLYMNDPEELNRFGLQSAKAFNKYEISEIMNGMERAGFHSVQAREYHGENETGFFLTGIK